MVVDTAKVLRQFKRLEELGSRMRLAAEEWDEDWKAVIAILMSAQSRDEVTIAIAENLFKRFPTLTALSSAKYEDVLHELGGLNYNLNKAKYVIATAKILLEQYGGNVPHDAEKLVELPGVGRKTANVFLAEHGYAAIGVDTHASYISQKLGWAKNRNPDKIEDDLRRTFPREYWKKVNRVLVRFGKTYTSRLEKDRILEEIRKIK